MLITKRKGFNLAIILKELADKRIINDDGSTSWADFNAPNFFQSYITTTIYAENKSGAFLKRVVQNTINSQQELTENTFIENANRIADQLDRTERRKLKVVFPIWGGDELLFGSRRWDNVHIRFNVNPKSSFLRKAIANRSKQKKILLDRIGVDIKGLSNLPLTVCTVNAIDAFDAFELAEKALSIELGLYSFLEGRGKSIFSSGRVAKPISKIIFAPHMTVHEMSGSLMNDIFWYNEWPNNLTTINRKEKDIENIKLSIKNIRNRVQKLPTKWKITAKAALARHFDAFSQKDLEASFLDAWRLLEIIAGNPHEKNETLVRRAAWFFSEADFQKQIGLHLMHRRNLISHGRPVKASDHEELAFQMREFIYPMFKAILMNPFKFKSIEEFWQFCDLPLEKETRDRQAYLLECTSTFRSEK